jgi:hypothetical protein
MLIGHPGTWQQFQFRPDNKGLNVMEMKSKYLHEQYLFENELFNLQQQQNMFMNGGGGGPTPSSEPTPPPPSYATELRLEFNNDLQTVESDFGVDPRSLSTWNAKFPNAEFESIEIDTTNAYAPIITLKGNTVNEGQIGDQAFTNRTTISTLRDINANCIIETAGTESFNQSSIVYVDLGALTTLNTIAFDSCTSLTAAYLPSLVSTNNGTSTGATFRGCINLADVNFDSLERAGDYTFYDCQSLSDFENGFKALAEAKPYSFSRSGVSNVFSFSLISIYQNAFYRCNQIRSISLLSTDPIIIGKNAFEECIGLNSITTTGDVTLDGLDIFLNVQNGGTYDFQGGVTDNGDNIPYLISIDWTPA